MERFEVAESRRAAATWLRGRTLRTAAVVLLGATSALAVAATAGATTRFVTSTGVDSGACGAVTSPCRSITRAITNAAANDSISVGPGFYGDIDGDGTLGSSPGEEPGSPCTSGTCLVTVNKSVKIFSTDGAGATILQAPSVLSLPAVVSLESAAAEFGKPNKGFTLSGGAFYQLAAAGVSGLKVAGNRAIAGAFGSGILVVSDNAVVKNNVAKGDGSGGFGVYGWGTAATVAGNVGTGFTYGVVGAGTGSTVTGNVATGNAYGLALSIDDSSGLGPPAKVDKNSTVGNFFGGIYVATSDNAAGGSTMTLGRGNVFGNGELAGGVTPNCGIVVSAGDATDSLTVNTAGFFWGASGGPGVNPADAINGVCNYGAGAAGVTVNATTPALKPLSIKAPPQR